jgi:26S proteasome regulatory subunit N5
LKRVIFFLILAPYDNEQSHLLGIISEDPRNARLVPEAAELLKKFTIKELMKWSEIAENFGGYLCDTDIFDAEAGDSGDAKAHQRWQDLKKRVIEYNVRVVSTYYTRIRMPRLCQHLDLSEDETEKYISELVTAKTIYAKIDRPARIVSFAMPKNPDNVLNDWSGDMRELLKKLETIDHLITKEEMMARIQPAKAEKSKSSKVR